MTLEEIVLRVMAQVEPLLPYMLAVAVLTAVVLPVLLLLSRGVWVTDQRFRWLGLFLGLKGWDVVRLACAWIKLGLLVSFLVAFRKMDVTHHLLFLIPGLLYALSGRELVRIPARLLWLGLEEVGLLSGNLICGYIRDMSPGASFWAVYVVMSIFMILFGIYLFLTEINDISAGRSAELDYEWQTDPRFGDGGEE